MQGKLQSTEQSSVAFDFDSFIPKDHLLKKIDKIIDLNFIRKITEPCYCSNNGRPSIDPELFFRMLIIGYLHGIFSDRQLCREIHFNIAYRWFCKLGLSNKVPNHSSLTRIRDRLGINVFKEIFLNIIEQCKKLGLIKGICVMTDGTLFQANASLDSMVSNNKKVEQDLETNKLIPGVQVPKIKEFNNKTHISSTDPDASLAFKKGTVRSLKYKNHLTIDADTRVILDTTITTGSTHESQVYLDQINAVEKNTAIKIQIAIADRAYGSGDIIQKLLDQNIKPNIPLFSGRSGKRDLEQEGFIYNKEQNFYICSQGKILLPYPGVVSNVITFHTVGDVCGSCTVKNSCTAKKYKNSNIRSVPHHVHKELFALVKQEMAKPDFRKSLSERMWKLEGLMSEIKLRHNMYRAKYRGINKVQIQAYMAAYVINVKRIVAYIFIFIFTTTLWYVYRRWYTKCIERWVFQQSPSFLIILIICSYTSKPLHNLNKLAVRLLLRVNWNNF